MEERRGPGNEKPARWPRAGAARVVLAGGVGAVLSGVPSTVEALLRGSDPLAAARAAGSLLSRDRSSSSLARGLLAHVVISAVWTTVLASVVRRVSAGPSLALRAAIGTLAGALIAGLDLELIGRRWFPPIRDLARAPQWADHLAFGVLVSVLLPEGRAGPSEAEGSSS